jgi:hypothetical protein
MMQIHIETNPGAGWQYHSTIERTDDEQVAALAQQLVNPDPDEPQFAAPTTETLQVAAVELTGLLDEGAIIALQLGESVVELAQRARDRKWGQERVRALI